MSGVPAGRFVNLYINGSWVDVTSYWDFGKICNIRVGRSTPTNDAQVATLDGGELNNADGRFTPKSALLNNPVTFAATTTANPYYPYLLPRVLIRTGYVISAVTYYDFWGYVDGWNPCVENGIRPYVPVSAKDRGTILAGITITNGALQSMSVDSPIALWPFTDPSDATTYSEVVGGKTAQVVDLEGGATVTSGSEGGTEFPDGLTGLTANVDTAGLGVAEVFAQGVTAPAVMNTAWSFEAWIGFQPSSSTGHYASASVVMSPAVSSSYVQILVSNGTSTVPGAVYLNYVDPFQSCSSAPYQPSDGAQHLYTAVGTDNGANLTVKFYVNGTLFDTQTIAAGHGVFGADGTVRGDWGTYRGSGADASGSATYGPSAIFASSLTAARVAQHYYAGAGGIGQRTDQRIAEYLTSWAGVATADQALDAGIQIVGQHSVAGKSILQLCQDMASTEGGGSVFYHDMNGGKSTFLNRNFRNGSTPFMTVDAVNDFRKDAYSPAFDDKALVNQSTLSRPNGAAQTYTNTASVTQYGLSTDYASTEVYPNTDGAVLNLAQDRVASQANPAFRLGQVTVPLVTATTAGLYPLAGTAKIGNRLRVTSLVPGKNAPLATVDVFIEGFTKSFNISTYDVVFDTSPADNPFRGGFDTVRYAPTAGDLLLSTALTNSATTVVLKWTAGPKVTTTSGSYPLYIIIDEEVIQLVAVPGGSTSPQTWTSCVRGALGTRAAAHSVNSVIRLYPDYRYQL